MATYKYYENKEWGWSVWIVPSVTTTNVNGEEKYCVDYSISYKYYTDYALDYVVSGATQELKDDFYSFVKNEINGYPLTINVNANTATTSWWAGQGIDSLTYENTTASYQTPNRTANDTNHYITLSSYAHIQKTFNTQAEAEAYLENPSSSVYFDIDIVQETTDFQYVRNDNDTLSWVTPGNEKEGDFPVLRTLRVYPSEMTEGGTITPKPEPEPVYSDDDKWGEPDTYIGGNTGQWPPRLFNAKGECVFEFDKYKEYVTEGGVTHTYTAYEVHFYPYYGGFYGYTHKQVWDLLTEWGNEFIKVNCGYEDENFCRGNCRYDSPYYSLSMTGPSNWATENYAVTPNDYLIFYKRWDYDLTGNYLTFKISRYANPLIDGFYSQQSFSEARITFVGNDGYSTIAQLGAGIYRTQAADNNNTYTGPFKILVWNGSHTSPVQSNVSINVDGTLQTVQRYNDDTAYADVSYMKDGRSHYIQIQSRYTRLRLKYDIQEASTPVDPPQPSDLNGAWYFDPDSHNVSAGIPFSFRYDPDTTQQDNHIIRYSINGDFIKEEYSENWVTIVLDGVGIYTIGATFTLGDVQYYSETTVNCQGSPFPDWSGNTYGTCFTYHPTTTGTKILHIHQEGDDDFTTYDNDYGTIAVWEKPTPKLEFSISGSRIVGYTSRIYAYSDSDSPITIKINGNIIGVVSSGSYVNYTWTVDDEVLCILGLSVVETENWLARSLETELDVRYYTGFDVQPANHVINIDAQTVHSTVSTTRIAAGSIGVNSIYSWLHPRLEGSILYIDVDESVDGERSGYVTVYGTDTYGSIQSKAVYVTQKEEYIRVTPNNANITASGGTIYASVTIGNLSGVTCTAYNTQVDAELQNLTSTSATLGVTVNPNYVMMSQDYSVDVEGIGIYSGKRYKDTLTIHQDFDPNLFNDVKDGLYINGIKADLSQDVKIALNYAASDTENPEAVKNTYSKTVDLVGTDTNNKIFGTFWELDRSIYTYPSDYDPLVPHYTPTSGATFNPKKRVDFEFWHKGEIVEIGYISLDKVTCNDGIVKYSVTLYGGLGDFFYNLMYDEDGQEKTLASLYYGFNGYFEEDENDKVLIQWNKDYILDSWGYLYSGVDHSGNTVPVGSSAMTIANHIVAVPTYSGTYDDFDNNKVLVDTTSFAISHSGRYGGTTRAAGDNSAEYTQAFQTLFPSSFRSETDTATTYQTKYGYGLMELQRDFVEWETRDLRSSYQRPAIKLKTILDAISNPDNNGGYTIDWPDDVYDSGTSLGKYYQKSYVLMNRIDFEDSEENLTRDLVFYPTDAASRTYYNDYTHRYFKIGLKDSMDEYDFFYFDQSGITSPRAEISISPMFEHAGLSSSSPASAHTVYEIGTYDYYGDYNGRGGTQRAHYTGTSVMVGGFCYRLVSGYGKITDSTFTITEHSPWYFNYSYDTEMKVTSKVEFSNGWRSSTGPFRMNKNYIDWESYGIDPNDVVMTFNPMQRNTSPSVTWYTFQSPIQAKCNGATELYRYGNDLTSKWWIEVMYVYGYNNDHPASTSYYGMIGTGSQWAFRPDVEMAMYNGEEDDQYINGWYNYSPSLVQSVNLKKNTLFRNTSSPYDYLIGFSRLFNLRYHLDTIQKKVRILKRPDYFIDTTEDITDKIDRAKDVKITPTTTENKWYDYTLETPETYATSLYKTKYGEEYGGYSYNTGYYFNSERKNLFEDDIYKNVALFRLQSPYFNTSIQLSGSTAYPTVALIPYYKWTLWKQNEQAPTQLESGDKDMYGAQSYHNVSRIYDWTKICCFDKDNSNVDDIDNALIFFEGTTHVSFPYQITDNLPIMNRLNGGTPCYLLAPTESGEVVTGKIDENETGIIAYRISTLPVFSKGFTGGASSYDVSYDFKKPLGSFAGNGIDYDPDSCIYDGYWKGYIEDLYDNDAKKVECYFFLKQNPKEAMRHFYYFDNSLWVLNNITDYDPRKEEPTKCTFVKIKSKTDYLR